MYKKILSLLLSIAMVFGLATVAFASSSSKTVYVCMGDSVAAGWKDDGSVTTGFYVTQPHAYHTLVAKELNAKLYQLAHNGFRTNEVRYIVDPDYDYPDYSSYNHADECADAYELSAKQLKTMRKQIASADYLTLGIGSNDFITEPFTNLSDRLDADGETLLYTACQDMIAEIDAGEDVNDALNELLDIAKKAGRLTYLVPILIAEIVEGFENYAENLPAIIDAIYELNPDVEILIIGIMSLDPTEYVDIPDLNEALYELGDIMNFYNEKVAEDYADQGCKYVRISNIDGTKHPTEEGHKKIAKLIIKAIKKD